MKPTRTTNVSEPLGSSEASVCAPGTCATTSEAASAAILPGEPWPLGAHPCCDGTNFAIFSRHAPQMELWLFESPKAREPYRRIRLDPERHRTGDIWHVRIAADVVGHCYGFQVAGSSRTEAWDGWASLLLDPAASLVAPRAQAADRPDNASASQPEGNALVGVVADKRFDWQGVSSPHRPWGETILYETHVRGLTIDASAGVSHPGQYLGLIDKIPYLQALGVTALELLPVQAFAETLALPATSANGERVGRRQYWGYNPIALFAPHPGYASGTMTDSAVTEFKALVRELHRAGLEVILDVVFNHTAEGGRGGPTLSFRGLDDSIYYLKTPDGGDYLDFTGCGNTLNCNHPVVRSLIIECLRHWVVRYHIDGFRFDLASVLGRGEDGAVLSNPPLLEEIAEDPILRGIKLIAEAWDSGGAFQVGRFPGLRWGEWNSRFRDEVRRFWRGDPGLTGALASRLCGSADLYDRGHQSPVKSINFVTSHDGFTLKDLVSYAVKHNEANGEGNSDGLNENYSANYGTEGATSDPTIGALRLKQMKNLLGTLLLSRGVPMILGGDEFARTQDGNNNAYCQDNPLSWYDWRLLESNAHLLRFVSQLIKVRKSTPALRAEHFYSPEEIDWLAPNGESPAWHGPANRLGCIIRTMTGALALFFNATPLACRFDLTASRLVAQAEHSWRVRIDTSRAAPDDAPEESTAPVLPSTTAVHVDSRSLLLLQRAKADT